MKLPSRKSGALAARGLYRNMVWADHAVWAWYRIGPLPWSMRSLEERERSHAQQVSAWAALTGREIHLRMSSVVFPRNVWAKHLDDRTPDPLPDQPGDLTWSELLGAQQDKIATSRLSQPFRAVGVKIPSVSKSAWTEVVEKEHRGLTVENSALLREIREIDRFMTHPGFTPRTRPALTTPELWWLLHRSVALGVEPPSTGSIEGTDLWEHGHMAEFVDPVRVEYRAKDPTVPLRVVRDGVEVERHVVVLNAIQLPPRSTAEHQQPWLPAVDRFPFPVEVSAHLDVIGGRSLSSTMERLQQRALNIGYHARESRRPEAKAIALTVKHARDAQHEVEEAGLEEAARVYGVIRFAVVGETREQALDRAHKVETYYASEQHIRLVQRQGQYALYREFIPGEAVTLDALDVERMPNAYWATGWPGASSSVGDGIGIYTGHTLGVARRAVMVDPHYPILKHETSALVLGTGTLGSGKTALLGKEMAYAARRGHLVACSDYDGWLTRLADIPALKPYTQVLNLTQGDIQPGLLNPWLMIPPGRDAEEEKDVRLQRRSLAIDTILRFLPASVTRAEGVRRAVSQAVTAAGSDYGTDPWLVLKALTDANHPEIAADLRENVESRAGHLVFGRPRQQADMTQAADWDNINFTIVASPGLPPIPAEVDPIDWDLEVQLSIPIRILSQILITRIARHPDRDLLKVLGFDEVGIGSQSVSYVNHIQSIARTNRGNSTAMYLFSQDAHDLARLGVSNWATRFWLGRAVDKEDAALALSLAGLPVGSGYEVDVLPNLSRTRPGQFLYVDEVGQAEVVQVDYSAWPTLSDALTRRRPKIEEQEWLAGKAA